MWKGFSDFYVERILKILTKIIYLEPRNTLNFAPHLSQILIATDLLHLLQKYRESLPASKISTN